jgi:ribosomal-protein-alanine N-acetyltransferase
VFKVRLFKPTDMFSVIKLAFETLPERYNPSLFSYFYETFLQGFIVAEKAHKIIGFIVGVKTNPETAKILMLSVTESYRRQNIGSALLARFLKEMQVENIKNIELEVRIDNKKAIKFYQKHDFKIIKKIPKFYQNGEDAYTMKQVI